MSERTFAVIGHPIGHTMSPFIHKRLFELARLRGDYTVLDVAPEQFPEKMSELDRLVGYNVTIPDKQPIIPFLDKLDKRAEMYGSVNTVRNGKIREGFTTDPDGFLKSLASEGVTLSGDVVILGCGGVARTFLYEAALAGCSITLVSRERSALRRNALAEEVRNKISGADISCCLVSEFEQSGRETGLLINATPVGMYPQTDACPVSEKAADRCACVFDAIYNPLKTKLVQRAEANGARAVGGMGMLVWQAVSAHEIWDGTVYDPDDIRQLIEDSAAQLAKSF